MEEKRTFTIQTLIATLVLNAILLAVVLLTVGNTTQSQLLIILVVGILITLILWFTIRMLGNRLLDQVAQSALASVADRTELASKVEVATKPEPEPALPEPPTVDTDAFLAQGAKTGAIQMLAILQRQGRLVDFLQEDLSAYADDQIGAAVRSIHEGSKQSLEQHVRLEPVYSEEEGSRITVPAGFDPEQVRLSGNVVGDPPFTGELRHRGWRVATIDLPKRMNDEETLPVVAAAEVEV